MFAALAEFERELIIERAKADLAAATLYQYVNGDGFPKEKATKLLNNNS